MRLRICRKFGQWADIRPVHFRFGVTALLRKAEDTELDWTGQVTDSALEHLGR